MVPYLVRLTLGATLGALMATGILLLIGVDGVVPIAVIASMVSAICATWAVAPDDDEDEETVAAE